MTIIRYTDNNKELDHKEDWGLKDWCFWIVVLEKTLKSPLDSKEIKPINLEYSLEGLKLKLKIQYFGHLMQRANALEKTFWENLSGKDWEQEEKGMTEDEMVRWHHWFNGHDIEQTLGNSEEQRSLECCSPWGHKESDTT